MDECYLTTHRQATKMTAKPLYNMYQTEMNVVLSTDYRVNSHDIALCLTWTHIEIQNIILNTPMYPTTPSY